MEYLHSRYYSTSSIVKQLTAGYVLIRQGSLEQVNGSTYYPRMPGLIYIAQMRPQFFSLAFRTSIGGSNEDGCYLLIASPHRLEAATGMIDVGALTPRTPV